MIEEPRSHSQPSRPHRMLRSLLRITTALVLILSPSACLMMQPSSKSNTPASLLANPQHLSDNVRILSESFAPLYQDHPENLAKCHTFLINQFRACGAHTEEQIYHVNDCEFKNVRAFFGPPNAPRIIVGAHYDTCDGNAQHINPGADDNASGVAGLLELAKLLQQQRPVNTTVELVAYCTEEPPYFSSHHMGSYRHAELLKKEHATIKGAIILEMIGYYSDEPRSQHYPVPLMNLLYPTTGSYISLVGGGGDRKLLATCKQAMQGSQPLPVYSCCIPRSFDFVHLSDHRNYWTFDFPAIMVTDTSFYRNPHYHQTTDTWQTLDYPRMAQAVTQIHQAILQLSK